MFAGSCGTDGAAQQWWPIGIGSEREPPSKNCFCRPVIKIFVARNQDRRALIKSYGACFVSIRSQVCQDLKASDWWKCQICLICRVPGVSSVTSQSDSDVWRHFPLATKFSLDEFVVGQTFVIQTFSEQIIISSYLVAGGRSYQRICQVCSSRPAPRKNRLPRPAKSRPCPAKLTKSAGRSRAKVTVDSIDTPFHYAHKWCL